MKINTKAFARGVEDVMHARPVRWWMFKRVSEFGWWICPEPHKSRLQAVMPHWPVDEHREDRGKA